MLYAVAAKGDALLIADRAMRVNGDGFSARLTPEDRFVHHAIIRVECNLGPTYAARGGSTHPPGIRLNDGRDWGFPFLDDLHESSLRSVLERIVPLDFLAPPVGHATAGADDLPAVRGLAPIDARHHGIDDQVGSAATTRANGADATITRCAAFDPMPVTSRGKHPGAILSVGIKENAGDTKDHDGQ